MELVLYLDRISTGWIAPVCGWRTYSITSSAVTCNVRHTEPERLRGLEIERQLELGRLHDRQVGRIVAL